MGSRLQALTRTRPDRADHVVAGREGPDRAALRHAAEPGDDDLGSDRQSL